MLRHAGAVQPMIGTILGIPPVGDRALWWASSYQEVRPGDLVVDYPGLSQDLKQALATYTESGGTSHTALDKQKRSR